MAIKTASNKIENQSPSTLDVAKICAAAASDKKAEKIVIINVGPLTTIADYFVVCSASSDRQVQAIVRNVEDSLREHGIRPLNIEGLDTSNWVLVDLGDVIFHCFTGSARDYYDLDGFWIDADSTTYE